VWDKLYLCRFVGFKLAPMPTVNTPAEYTCRAAAEDSVIAGFGIAFGVEDMRHCCATGEANDTRRRN
jgi:hypothetical protein